MPNIRVRQALERIQSELNKIGEHAAYHSGISRKDAVSVKYICDDIAKTAAQIKELARTPVD